MDNNNKRKFNDLYYEIYNIRYHKKTVPIRQFKNLIEKIKLHLDRCYKDEHDEHYYDILDLHHDLIELSKSVTKKGSIQKIPFNHIYDKINTKYIIKNKEKEIKEKSV
jgi:hypothetical protein